MQAQEKHRRGFPSSSEIAEVRQRLARGENFEQICQIYERKPETMAKFLRSSTQQKYMITTRSGATIPNLSFRDVERLAPLL